MDELEAIKTRFPNRKLTLSLYPTMTFEEIDLVCNSIIKNIEELI